MTAAQIRAAAKLTEHLPDDAIVTFMEMGSEGCMFRTGIFKPGGPRYYIDRDGTISGGESEDEKSVKT